MHYLILPIEDGRKVSHIARLRRCRIPYLFPDWNAIYAVKNNESSFSQKLNLQSRVETQVYPSSRYPFKIARLTLQVMIMKGRDQDSERKVSGLGPFHYWVIDLLVVYPIERILIDLTGSNGQREWKGGQARRRHSIQGPPVVSVRWDETPMALNQLKDPIRRWK